MERIGLPLLAICTVAVIASCRTLQTIPLTANRDDLQASRLESIDAAEAPVDEPPADEQPAPYDQQAKYTIS